MGESLEEEPVELGDGEAILRNNLVRPKTGDSDSLPESDLEDSRSYPAIGGEKYSLLELVQIPDLDDPGGEGHWGRCPPRH